MELIGGTRPFSNGEGLRASILPAAAVATTGFRLTKSLASERGDMWGSVNKEPSHVEASTRESDSRRARSHLTNTGVGGGGRGWEGRSGRVISGRPCISSPGEEQQEVAAGG